MKAGHASVGSEVTRRTFLAAGVASAALAAGAPAFAQQPAAVQPVPRGKEPAVWLDMDQAELDAAYDQIKYAPNLPQIVKRYATNSEAVQLLVADGYNHFEIPETLASPYGLLGRAVLVQMSLSQG